MTLAPWFHEPARAQSWSPPFNHNQPHAGNGVFTSPYAPWNGAVGSFVGAFPPVSPGVDHVEPQVTGGALGVVFSGPGWPQPEAGVHYRCFNAIHMAVIPKGPFRGHVLVWDAYPVKALVHPPGVPVPPVPFPGYQCHQAYSIIDPADVPLGGIRYRNFLVPIGGTIPQPASLSGGTDLFCSGHAWSPYGDLIVAGGTDFVIGTGGAVTFAGGTLNYVFNPRLPCYWPGTGFAYYPASQAGMWVEAPSLQVPRWYPTVTMTHGLQRETLAVPPGTALDKERAVVLGGSEASPPGPGDRANQTYEALVVLGESAQQNSNLVVDQGPGVLLSFTPDTVQQDKVWDGPIILGLPNTDWLYEYPRTFLLSTGDLFVCGYAPRAAWLDHDGAPGTWANATWQPGLPLYSYSSNWQDIRHDGSAVLFPNLGGNTDTVLRLGGATDASGTTTDTVETIDAGQQTSTWVAAAAMPPQVPGPPDGGRIFTNLVILPTGDLLVSGGQWQDGAGLTNKCGEPMLFSGGQWTKLPANPVPSPRTYHSTAVLLPDGRVFLGGGDDREWDYEIFSPPYLNSPVVRPVNVVWPAPTPFVDPVTGAFELNYGQTYKVHCDPLPVGHAVVKAVLTAPCSVTHHSDMHQRYVELDVRVKKGYQVELKVPPDEREAPRGIYMLWLVTNTGTPSVAEWVVLR